MLGISTFFNSKQDNHIQESSVSLSFCKNKSFKLEDKIDMNRFNKALSLSTAR
jgi:hypothetical protein